MKSSMYFQYAAFIALNLNKLELSSLGMFYVKYGGTWLGDSEEVNMWKYMEGHLDRQTAYR